MKHLSATPEPPSRRSAPTSRTRWTWSCCARSRRTRPRGTRAPTRWTPTSSASARGLGVSRADRGSGDDDPARRGLRATARRPRSCRRPRRPQARGRPPGRRRLLRLRRAARGAALDLAVAARDPARRRRRHRRLLRLPPDPGPAEPGEAGRRPVSRRDQGGERRPDRRGPRAEHRSRSTSTASRTTPSRRATSSTRTRTRATGSARAASSTFWVSTGRAQVTVPTSSVRTRTTRWRSSPR